MSEAPHVQSEIVNILKKKNKSHKDLTTIDQFFAKTAFFSKFKDLIDEDSYFKQLKCVEYEKVPAHQILFRKGDPGIKLYIIMSGSVNVMLNKNEKENSRNTFNEKKKLQRLFHEYNSSDKTSIIYRPIQVDNALNKIVSMTKLQDQGFSASPKKTTRKDQTEHISKAASKNPVNYQVVINPEGYLSPIKKPSPFDNQLANFMASMNSIDDENVLPIKRSRPIFKFAFWITKFWQVELKTNEMWRLQLDIPRDIFKSYNVCFYENTLFNEVKQAMDMDLIKIICPSWKEVSTFNVGYCFGEIALFKKCPRQATIYCPVDCEFAIITKRSDSNFEYQLKWQQMAVINFLKNFDLFNWWVKRNKIEELIHYIVKRDTKGIGDIIYKRGDKVKNIYFLKQGEIEIFYDKKKESKFVIKGTDLIINERKKTEVDKQLFRRNILQPYVFGVEELQADIPNRQFTARIKSFSCVYYELPKDKIFLGLMAKNPNFQSLLIKYSCITNDGLCHKSNLTDLQDLKKKSYVTIAKDSAQLSLQLLKEQKCSNSDIKKIMNPMMLNQINTDNKGIGNVQPIVKEVNKINLTVEQADHIMKNQTSMGSKKKFNLQQPHLGHFNDVCTMKKVQQVQTLEDGIADGEFMTPDEVSESQRKIKFLKNQQQSVNVKKPVKFTSGLSNFKEKPPNEMEVETQLAGDSQLDFRVNLHRFMSMIVANKKGMSSYDAIEEKITQQMQNGFKTRQANQNKTTFHGIQSNQSTYNGSPKKTERIPSVKKVEYEKVLNKEKDRKANAEKIIKARKKVVDKKQCRSNKTFNNRVSDSAQKQDNNATFYFGENVNKNQTKPEKINHSARSPLPRSESSNITSQLDRSNPILFDESWKSDIKTQLKALVGFNMHNHYQINIDTKKDQNDKVGFGVKQKKIEDPHSEHDVKSLNSCNFNTASQSRSNIHQFKPYHKPLETFSRTYVNNLKIAASFDKPYHKDHYTKRTKNELFNKLSSCIGLKKIAKAEDRNWDVKGRYVNFEYAGKTIFSEEDIHLNG